MIDAWLSALALKELPRAGWRRVGVRDPESVAAHSWGVSLLAVALAPDAMDRARLLSYAAVHDLAETLAGDITPHDGVSAIDKARAEQAAIDELATRGLPATLVALWHDYEAQADDEARYIRELDRLDMAVQALAYAPQAEVQEFVDSAAKVVTHPTLTPILAEIQTRLSSVG